MSHAEETRAIDEASSRRETPRGRLLVRVALSTLFLLSSLPLGIFWFLVLVVLVLIGLPLTLVWIGLPILALAMLVSIVGADTERWRLSPRLLAAPRFPFPWMYISTNVRLSPWRSPHTSLSPKP